MRLLEFHRHAFREMQNTFHQDERELPGDGLLVMAQGLGLPLVLSAYLRVHAIPENLVLLLNTGPAEMAFYRKELSEAQERGAESPDAAKIYPEYLKEVDSETPAKERWRAQCDKVWESLSNSRILIVDMLNKVVPIHMVAGILINHAHQVNDTSATAFILRLYRQGNKGFSDRPQLFVNEIGGLERTMKVLHTSSVNIWPRFHMQVMEEIDSKGSLEVIEIRVPLSKSAKEIQTALM